MKITKESAISAGLLLVSMINQVLTMFGHSPLPLENDAVKNVVSTVFLIGTSIYAWLSDNPISKNRLRLRFFEKSVAQRSCQRRKSQRTYRLDRVRRTCLG